MPQIINLTSHLLQQHKHEQNAHRLIDVINRIMVASKMLSRDINRAGLLDILGSAGTVNVQDEDQQKLDVQTNEIFIQLLKQSPYVAAVGTEEDPDLIVFDDVAHNRAEYIVYLDPVDGSSNIDVNVSVGTNFLLFKRKSLANTKLKKEDFLQSGTEAVCAGYVVYGASTMLVYTVGQGVDGFTLDASLGEFMLSHPQMKFPKECTIYSVNEGNYQLWSKEVQAYIEEIKANPKTTARYIGSLVADFHRNLLKGGVFAYPSDTKKPQGKLRLLYEAIPFALLATQAGGAATTGTKDILSIKPSNIHERTPLYIGTKKEVQLIGKYLSNS
jgi:fructose-1,6-bisphosphatase I